MTVFIMYFFSVQMLVQIYFSNYVTPAIQWFEELYKMESFQIQTFRFL
jgi:hypothetical protein